MKNIIFVLMVVFPALAMALPPTGSWQAREIKCSNGQPGKYPIDIATFKYLFNLDSDFTYDVVVINKGQWNVARGITRTTDSQICFNMKEAWGRERPFWYGSNLQGCWDYQQADAAKLTISFVARADGQDCDKGQTILVNFDKVD